MTLLLVRHGETALNANRTLQPADTPLSALGVAQAERLADRLADHGLVRIVTSHLPRARQTAQAIASRTGLVPEPWPELQERDFGDLRGTPYSQLPENLFSPELAPPGGETQARFDERVDLAWARLVRERAACGGPLLVVTHGLFCRSLAARHLRLPVEAKPRWHNTGLTIVSPEPPHVVELLDCAAHLDATRAVAPV